MIVFGNMRMTNIATPVEPRRPLRVTLDEETNGTWTIRAAATRVTLADRRDYFEARTIIREKGWTL